MLMRALTLLALSATPASAQFYTDAELQRVQDRAVPKLELVLHEDIVGLLPRAERPLAARIALEFPAKGPDPLAFYAEPDRLTITMPLESIRFFDDIATLFAWFQSKGCAFEPTQSYLHALLREHQPLPPPLVAFGIDRDAAFDDEYTYDLSSKIYSAGLLFILAHEVGHLVLGHEVGLTGPASQAQEIAADAFAMDHFARVGTMPVGILFYYIAAWWRDPVGPAAAASTHPVSPGRMAALARRMADTPMDFAHGEPDPEAAAVRVTATAGQIAVFANLASDEGMLTLMPLGLQRDFPLSRLQTVCPSD
ncbi:hypothetical protein [Tropicimonas sp. IMCC34043]|uniref:hypothetical protein n=1 Tax=Tropicimonas sp. IMCC34043 TaxID=2248760 RepID=UPI000E26FD2F|nr:hypothetical protein [Tropicimonas sp. IMCC34043]